METKVVAITGAYSGLGAELSRLLAKEGHKLVLGGKNKEKLDIFVSEIKETTEAIAVKMDVRERQDCEKFINEAINTFGRLDILVNNAGIWRMGSIDDVTEEEIVNIFKTNVFGPMFCSQAAVKVMRKQKSGHILNIGSTAAVDDKVSHIAYGSSKAAIVAFTRNLRKELENTGIRVTVFSPGGTKTSLFRTHPERMKDVFMDPHVVAGKILEHIKNENDDWHVILRRK